MSSLARIAGQKLTFVNFALRLTYSQKPINFIQDHSRQFAWKRSPNPTKSEPKNEGISSETDEVPSERNQDDQLSYNKRRREKFQRKAMQMKTINFEDLTMNIDNGKSETSTTPPTTQKDSQTPPKEAQVIPEEEFPSEPLRRREKVDFPPSYKPRRMMEEEPKKKPATVNLRTEFRRPEKPQVVKEISSEPSPPKESQAPKVVETQKIVETTKVVETPKVVEPPKVTEAPKVAETPKVLEAPKETRTIQDIPTPSFGKCPGCGVPLQTERPHELGYFVPRNNRKSSKAPPAWYVSKNSYFKMFSQEEILASINEARDQTKLWELHRRIEEKKALLKELEAMKHPILQMEEQQKLMQQQSREISENSPAVQEQAAPIQENNGVVQPENSPKTEVQAPIELPKRIPTIMDSVQPDEEGEDDFDADLVTPPTVDIDAMTDINEEQKKALKEEIENLQLEIEKELPPTSEFLTATDFVQMEKADKQKYKQEICFRCYQLKHYGKVVPVSIPMSLFREKLSLLATRKVVVFKVVDVFDFDGSFLPDFREIVGNNPVILIANKSDLLPRRVSYERVTTWLRRAAKERGLDIEDCFLVSSLWRKGIGYVIDKYLNSDPQRRDIFVMGCANTGKSTFINNLIREYRLDRKMRLLTSPIPGTTLNIITVPLPNGVKVYDTPGIQNTRQAVSLLVPEEVKMVLPRKQIVPKNFSIMPGKTIFLGGLARLDYLEGPRTFFTVFVSPFVPIHITKTTRANDLLFKHKGTLLRPPLTLEERGKVFPDLISKDIEFEGIYYNQAKADIVFSGVGWISITGKGNFKLRAWGAEGTGLDVREPPLLPYETPSSFNPDVKVKKI